VGARKRLGCRHVTDLRRRLAGLYCAVDVPLVVVAGAVDASRRTVQRHAGRPAKSCERSISERRRGYVPSQFLEKNSRKSGWQTAIADRHEHTYWDRIAMKSTSGGMERFRASKQRNACNNHSSPSPISWSCGWRWADPENPEAGSVTLSLAPPRGRPMAMPPPLRPPPSGRL
jgi:hypothetical protein